MQVPLLNNLKQGTNLHFQSLISPLFRFKKEYAININALRKDLYVKSEQFVQFCQFATIWIIHTSQPQSSVPTFIFRINLVWLGFCSIQSCYWW